MAQQKDPKTGKWMYYGSYVDNTGKRVQYKKRGFISKKSARNAEDDFREHIENPITFLNFANLASEYLLTEKKRVREISYHDTSLLIKRLNKDIEDVLISEFDADYLQKYVDSLDAKYSKEYVTKLFYTMNKIFRYAQSKAYCSANPLSRVKMDARKNEIKKEMLFWEPNDFKKFIDNVDSQLYKTLFTFLYNMGTRKGEALALTWNKIDLEVGSVRIDRSVATKLNNKITMPKTNNSIRTISMPRHLTNLMCDWKKHQESLYGFSGDSYVFGHYKVITAETLRRTFRHFIDVTNNKAENELDRIPAIRIHDLRHSHASYLINNMTAGFTDFDVAKRLGDTVSTLHDTYAHWFKAADKRIIDFMNEQTD